MSDNFILNNAACNVLFIKWIVKLILSLSLREILEFLI